MEDILEAVLTYQVSVFKIPPLPPPTSGAAGITTTFSLPPIHFPKPTVEDCDDEDSILESYQWFQGH
jgi:hypothetical protein